MLLFDLSNSFTSFEFDPPAIIMSLFFLLNWHAYKKHGMFDTLIPSQSRVSLSWHFLDYHCCNWSFCLHEAVKRSIPQLEIPSPPINGPYTFWTGFPILKSHAIRVESHPPLYTICWSSGSLLNLAQRTLFVWQLWGALDYLSSSYFFLLT